MTDDELTEIHKLRMDFEGFREARLNRDRRQDWKMAGAGITLALALVGHLLITERRVATLEAKQVDDVSVRLVRLEAGLERIERILLEQSGADAAPQ